MFSVGTIVIKCVEFAAHEAIPYGSLSLEQRMRFVIEAQRLCPTVTSVHRIVETPETVTVSGRQIHLQPGDEVAYPFLCINQDPSRFTDPTVFRLDRTPEEVAAVMSWSVGPHICPAKELSILLTVLMLDELATRYDLRRLRIANPEF
jgi:cytochrome P450